MEGALATRGPCLSLEPSLQLCPHSQSSHYTNDLTLSSVHLQTSHLLAALLAWKTPFHYRSLA